MTRDELIAALKEVPQHIYCREDPTRESLLCLTAAAVIALTPRTCGTCRHYDGDHGTTDGVRYGFCTNRRAWHSGRSMPPFDGCIAWAARDEEDGA
jgi:hypothetical protein